MKITIKIEGEAAARAAALPYEGAPHVDVAGACPGCGATALRAMGDRSRQRRNHDTIEAPAVTLCCSKEIGRIVVRLSTVFGIEQDEELYARVTTAGGRVY